MNDRKLLLGTLMHLSLWFLFACVYKLDNPYGNPFELWGQLGLMLVALGLMVVLWKVGEIEIE